MVYIQLKKSTNQDKKYMAIFYNEERKKIKTTHFGASGMSDYTIHKDEERKARYIARHSENENFNNYMSAGSLSRWILWNFPDFDRSVRDFMRRFDYKSL